MILPITASGMVVTGPSVTAWSHAKANSGRGHEAPSIQEPARPPAGGRVASACIPVARRQGATCPVTPGESRASTPSPSRAGASQPTESQARLAKKATCQWQAAH